MIGNINGENHTFYCKYSLKIKILTIKWLFFNKP